MHGKAAQIRTRTYRRLLSTRLRTNRVPRFYQSAKPPRVWCRRHAASKAACCQPAIPWAVIAATSTTRSIQPTGPSGRQTERQGLVAFSPSSRHACNAPQPKEPEGVGGLMEATARIHLCLDDAQAALLSEYADRFGN